MHSGKPGIFSQSGRKGTIHSFLKSGLLHLSSPGSTQYLSSNSPFSEVFSQPGEMAGSHSPVTPKWPDSGR